MVIPKEGGDSSRSTGEAVPKERRSGTKSALKIFCTILGVFLFFYFLLIVAYWGKEGSFGQSVLYVLMSLAVGILWIAHLRRYDLHEREPWRMYILTTAWGGAASVAVTILVSLTAIPFLPDALEGKNYLHAFLVVAPVEELAKLLALLLCYPFLQKELDEPTDGLIYMACVALGFSLIESYGYAMTHSGELLLWRAVICTPTHILDSVFMGLAVYFLWNHRVGWKLLLVSYLFAVGMHGLWDAVIFEGWTAFILIGVIVVSRRVSFTLIELGHAISPHRRSFKSVVESTGPRKTEKHLLCPRCGETRGVLLYRRGSIRLWRCLVCHVFLTKHKTLKYLLRRFGAQFLKGVKARLDVVRVKKRKEVRSEVLSQERLEQEVFYSLEDGLVVFHLETLSRILDGEADQVVLKVEEAGLVRTFFSMLDGQVRDILRGSQDRQETT